MIMAVGLTDSKIDRGVYFIDHNEIDYNSLIDCRWHRHTARKARLLTAKFFKRQVLASSSLLHSLLPNRRDNDTTSSL